MLPEKLLEYVRENLNDDIADLLDDPYAVTSDPVSYVAKLRELAQEAGLDFDRRLAVLGTDFLRKRLKDYMERTRAALHT